VPPDVPFERVPVRYRSPPSRCRRGNVALSQKADHSRLGKEDLSCTPKTEERDAVPVNTLEVLGDIGQQELVSLVGEELAQVGGLNAIISPVN